MSSATPTPTEATSTERVRAYWRHNLAITGGLLAIWFVVTFVAIFHARELSFRFFDWPFSFWVAAQGALIVYVVLVCCYARWLNRLDEAYGIRDEE